MQEEKNIGEESSGSLLDKAKTAVSTVSEKVIEVKDDMIGDEQKSIMDEFKDSGLAKIKQVMEELNNSFDLIKKSGYEFKEINVSLGIPPSVSTSFHYTRDISDAEKKELLEETKEKKYVLMTLKCLFKAGDFYHSIKMSEYVLDGVSITLGLTPGINVEFIKKGTK